MNVVMWSWCGQVSSAPANIKTYLSLMSRLEEDYPDVRFVYMTGHTDGTGLTGNLHVRNQQIRDYCKRTTRSSTISRTSRATTPTATTSATGRH